VHLGRLREHSVEIEQTRRHFSWQTEHS
jgi:hypothetical protein